MLKFNDFCKKHLFESSKQLITESDFIDVIPIRGKKREIKLNRASLELELDPNILEVRKDTYSVQIPSIRGIYLKLKIRLNQYKDIEFYDLVTETGEFFVLNGNLVSSAIPRNGDIIDLGYNKVIFRKDNPNLKNTLEKLVLKPSYLSSSLPILLVGETGTGKTTIARKIHDKSEVRGNFVHLNLSSFSKELIESEIFGHKKGAFTGALTEKSGAIMEANFGTLFLDEIDSISLSLQTKLLTFLDNSEFRVVGGGTKKAYVRMIYSSGKNLKDLVSSGKMRLDFYYRLKNSLCIQIPSLRSDKKYLESVLNEILMENNLSMARSLLKVYLDYSWPGNIRQLKSHIKRKLVETKGTHLTLDFLDMSLDEDSIYLRKVIDNSSIMTLNAVKKKYIKEILIINEGDLKKTSKLIGVSENTIRRII